VPLPGDTSPGDAGPGGDDGAPSADPQPSTTAPSLPKSTTAPAATGGGPGPASSTAVPPAATTAALPVFTWASSSIDLPWWVPTALPWDTTVDEATLPWAPIASWPGPLSTAPVEVSVGVTVPQIVPTRTDDPASAVVGILTPGAVEVVVEIGAPLAPVWPTDMAQAPSGAPMPEPDARDSQRADHRAPATSPARAAARPVPVSFSEPAVDHASPKAAARASAAPRHSGGSPLPFGVPRPLQGSGSSASSGGVPSLLTFGFATLIGFFVFAAPGLGRRIRLARSPSPRGRHHSPLDRPG
jgi:hypothetical protein